MSTDLLADRICLVTGSSRGIGLGIAKSLAANGATVVLHGRNEESLQKSLASLPEPSRHNLIAADLMTAEGVRRLADGFLDLHERLDVLVHSAGVLGPPRTPLADYPETAWNEVLQVNLTGPFLVTQALLPALRKGDRPSVIFISSGLGHRGRAGWGGYACHARPPHAPQD